MWVRNRRSGRGRSPAAAAVASSGPAAPARSGSGTTTLVHVDSPVSGATVTTPYVLIAGWVATDASEVIASPRIVDARGRRLDLSPVARPDVEAHHPTLTTIGFQRLLALDELDELAGDEPLRLVIEVGGEEVARDLDVHVPPGAAAELHAAKQRKRSRLLPLLRCPRCAHGGLDEAPPSLVCPSCAASYPAAPGDALDFLPEDLRHRFQIVDTSNISAWGYDARATEIVERHRGGLVLDCGSGLRPEYLDDVVNYEIVHYPTTDVVGVGQVLPFVDDAFDAVFSFAVLEHVDDPFTCARELVRVLRPGGTLFAVVPFLQPFHGFPSHYYNMTSSGLKHLFDHDLQIEVCAVPEQGLPIFAVSWILNSYARGLPADVAQRFREMSVAELMQDPWTMISGDVVTALSPAANEELAATNFVIATKPPR